MDSIKFMEKIKELQSKYNLQKWFLHYPLSGDYQREILLWIKKNIPHNAKILEMGCGMGHDLIQLNDFGFNNLYGIERDTPSFAAAQEMFESFKCPVHIINRDANDGIPKEWGDFDLILPMGFTYFEQVNQDKVFQHCHDRLNVGGHLILDVVDKDYNPKKKHPYFNRKSVSDIIEFSMKNSFTLLNMSDSCYPKFIGYLKKDALTDKKKNELEYWKTVGIKKGTDVYSKYLDLFDMYTRDKVVMDAGCGPLGGVCSRINDAKQKIGLDPQMSVYFHLLDNEKPQDVLYCRRRAEKIDVFPDERIDIIFCTDTLDHIVNPEKAVKEFYRILKNGGTVCLLVHLRKKEQLNKGHTYSVKRNYINKWFSDFKVKSLDIYETDPVNGCKYETLVGVFEKWI